MQYINILHLFHILSHHNDKHNIIHFTVCLKGPKFEVNGKGYMFFKLTI